MKSFTVTPMKQKITLEPGAEYEGYLEVTNPAASDEAIEYTATVGKYVLDTEDGTSTSLAETMNQLATWITIEDGTGKLGPNESGTVKFRIKVPTNAPAGGQYAVIGVSLDEKATSDSVIVQDVMELGSVIYAEVEGETVHSGQLLSNNIPGFITTTPATLTARVENTGNVHETAEVEVVVKNALSGEVLFPLNDKDKIAEEMVMPMTARDITRDVTVLADLGVYEVTQNITYLGETTYNTRVLIVCPIWFIVLVFLTIVTAGWTIGMMVKRRKNQKRII